MVIRIKIIWAKTCPICKKLLKEVLIPLQTMLPDKIVLELKETTPLKDWEGSTPLLSGGYYKTAFGKTPEIYVKEKVYIIPRASYLAIYKFLKELLDILPIREETPDMTIYRKHFILKRISRIMKKIRKLAKKELEWYRWYYTK